MRTEVKALVETRGPPRYWLLIALSTLVLVASQPAQATLTKSWENYSFEVPPNATDFHARFDVSFSKGLVYPPVGASFSFIASWWDYDLNPLPASATPGTFLGFSCTAPYLFGRNLKEAWFTPMCYPLDLVNAEVTATVAYTDNGSGNYGGSYTVTNNDTQSVTVSNVNAWVDNSASNWGDDLTKVPQPTGAPVTGLPSSFSLAPGESTTFDLGTVSGTGYEMLHGRVAYTAAPDVYVDRGMATMVPEPTTLLLLSFGALILRRTNNRKLQHKHRA